MARVIIDVVNLSKEKEASLCKEVNIIVEEGGKL